MPVSYPEFTPHWVLKNGHLSTIWATLFRKLPVAYTRERIPTPDQDFLDLDWVKSGNSKLIIIGHGLEGRANSTYVLGLVQNAKARGYDTVSINWRGCSGVQNKKLITYHSGKSEDLKAVVDHIVSTYDYADIFIAGFSMGGNISLKYAGENSMQMTPRIKAIAAISVPVDLRSSSYQLAKNQNKVYMYRFLRTLKRKYLAKKLQFPTHQLNEPAILNATTFAEFDEHFTAPINGFKNAEDYWYRASSKPLLQKIVTPTLLLTALNDPFLASQCFPIREAENNLNLHLMLPKHGGHVGFFLHPFSLKTTFAEQQIFEFFSKF